MHLAFRMLLNRFAIFTITRKNSTKYLWYLAAYSHYGIRGIRNLSSRSRLLYLARNNRISQNFGEWWASRDSTQESVTTKPINFISVCNFWECLGLGRQPHKPRIRSPQKKRGLQEVEVSIKNNKKTFFLFFVFGIFSFHISN